MARQTNSDARRGTLLRFGHRASASSGLHERWSLIQPGRVPAPLCGMLLPFQAIPMQRTIEIDDIVFPGPPSMPSGGHRPEIMFGVPGPQTAAPWLADRTFQEVGDAEDSDDRGGP